MSSESGSERPERPLGTDATSSAGALFPCPYSYGEVTCEKSFGKRKGLDEHVRTYHDLEATVQFPGEAEETVQRDPVVGAKYKCPRCPASYTTASVLKRHVASDCGKTKISKAAGVVKVDLLPTRQLEWHAHVMDKDVVPKIYRESFRNMMFTTVL